MSNTTSRCEQECDTLDCSGAVVTLIRAKSKSLGEFNVRRSLPNVHHKMVGPWIFFDHMGPATFSPGQGINVRPHPHIGIATVTYLFEGEILHRDSLGSLQAIRPGDINLMVAGSGIVHSERERAEVTATEHSVHGLQLWLALPDSDEETDPDFRHFPSSEIPQISVSGVPVRVMIGAAFGVESPVPTFSETLYLEVHLQEGQGLTLPPALQRAVYVANGQVRIGEMAIPEHAMAVLKDDPTIEVIATSEARIALIGGEPVGERFIEWNFVSSSKQRIEQAKQDWLADRFAKVSGDETEYIPLPK